jgi:predicted nuclease with TOPRIM domain
MSAAHDTLDTNLRSLARIQELETTLHAAEKRNYELARHIELLSVENDKLRDEVRDLRTENASLRMQLHERTDEP